MNDRRASRLGGWLAIGAGFGVALGVALDNLGLWLPIGIVIGFVIGMLGSNRSGDA
jgi:hypothetical protein